MPGVTDHELIAQALHGNQTAFQTLVERHHAVVYSVVRGVLDGRDDVEDVVQNVYVKMYKGLDGFRGDSRLSTWLYRVARNEALNAARRRRLDTRPIEDVDLPAAAGDSPDAVFHRRRLAEQMGAAMSHLDGRYREALELRYMGQRSYDEIAEIMDLPLGTVKTYIHRGKVQLKRVFDRAGGHSVVGKRANVANGDDPSTAGRRGPATVAERKRRNG